MRRVECGIKAFDVHELLCHFLAKRLGYYADEGLDVRVVDVTFVPDERLPDKDYFQVACGAAYLGRREGHPFKVLLAATDRPMFWLHARPEIESVDDLAGERVATYPPVAPPHWFSRVALRNHGLDPDADVSFWPCRDDIIRLGMLRERDVDAAVISSAVSPLTVQAHGLRTLTLLGEEVQFVTTGVATSERFVKDQPDLAAALVRSFRRSLDAIHESAEDAIAVIGDVLAVSHERAAETYRLILPCYTRNGRVSREVLQRAVDRLDAEGAPGRPFAVDELYDFSLVDD
jgi:ABC-type nitrate/sulfonate/bicarbonate transport system substrate-binding protein